MQSTHELNTIPDDELLGRLAELLRHSRGTEAELVAHVGEVDARRLYVREASPSMYAYCTEVLHLSEAEAYLRIAVARASRAHPVLLEMLADGRLHLSAIAKLAAHLTPDNREALLGRATRKSKREVEELIAEIDPRPEVAASMRKLPDRRIGTLHLPAEARPDATAPAPASPVPPDGAAPVGGPLRPDQASPQLELRPDQVVSNGMGGMVSPETERPSAHVAPAGAGDRRFTGSPSRPSPIEPLAPARYKVQFTASAELRDKLERLRTLMRPSIPDGDLAAVIETAVTEKLERLEARRFGRTKAPREPAAILDGTPASEAATSAHARSSSVRHTPPVARYIPAAVRRAVCERDGGQCRFVDAHGRRCTARVGLQFHHRRPFGFGGDHSVEQISLVCGPHNRYLAEVDYGRKAMARHRRPRPGALGLTAPTP